MIDPTQLTYDDKGLVTAVVQTPGGEVRMVGHMNAEALARTQESGWVTFWSRSRQCLWTKGLSSGNRLKLISLHQDCDADALLVVAEPEGPTCHRGMDSCFDSDCQAVPSLPWLSQLETLLRERKEGASLAGSYTQKLFAQGPERMGKKVIEEAGEAVIAALLLQSGATPLRREEFLNEAADLVFHLQVLLVGLGFSLEEVAEVLRKRHRRA